MNYSNYFPASYQPVYPNPTQFIPQQPVPSAAPQNNQANNNGSINWVMGEAAARSYAVAPGQSVLLLDSDSSVFYIKSADASGMPLPLRIFDYKERTQQPHTEPQVQQSAPLTDYVTREEFEKRIAELMETRRNNSNRKERTDRNESTV